MIKDKNPTVKNTVPADVRADKQPKSKPVIKRHVGLFTVNMYFIKPSVVLVCYFWFDSYNQD